jgi:hypothetical protein
VFVLLPFADSFGEHSEEVAMQIHRKSVYRSIQFLKVYVKEEKYMRIKEVSNLVHEILINEPACRNSDNILYWRVLQVLGTEKGIDVSKMSVPALLFHMREYGLPSIESVGRARRKIQEHNPELGADDTVEAHRMLLEEEYREYASLYTV